MTNIEDAQYVTNQGTVLDHAWEIIRQIVYAEFTHAQINQLVHLVVRVFVITHWNNPA